MFKTKLGTTRTLQWVAAKYRLLKGSDEKDHLFRTHINEDI